MRTHSSGGPGTGRPPVAEVAPAAAPHRSRRREGDAGSAGPPVAPRSQAVLDERDRIAAELYDSVIHRLFAAGLSLHSAAGRLRTSTASESTSVAAAHIGDAVRTLDEAIGEIRAALYPAPARYRRAGRTNLPARLEAVVADMAAVLGFTPSTRMPAALADAVPTVIGDDLVIALREALANIVRHARARSATVTVEVETRHVTLQVVDDGVGVGADAWRGGLADLQARAEHHGGTLSTNSPDRPGTRLVWSVPM